MKNRFIFSTLMLINVPIFGQIGSTSYGSAAMMTNYTVNPATTMPDSVRLVIGLPNVQLDMSNSFKLSDLLQKSGDVTIADLTRFAGLLSPTNTSTIHAGAQLGHVGFRWKQYQFSFGSELYSHSQAIFSNTMAKLIFEGNHTNPDAVFRSESIYQQTFLNVYAGISRTYGKLTLGARVKRIYGIGHLESESLNYSLKTDPNSNPAYALQIQTEMALKSGGAFAPTVAALGGETFATLPTFAGKGVGIDLGVSYQATPKLQLTASAVNIGNLVWTRGVDAVTRGSGRLDWGGTSYNIGATNNVPLNSDSLSTAILDAFFPKVSEITYQVGLPTQLYIGASYQLNPKQQIGFMARRQSMNRETNYLLGLNYRHQLFKSLQWTGGLSWTNPAGLNFGSGLVWQLGPVQFHFMADNVGGFNHAKRVQLQTGLNLVFQQKK